MRTLSSFTFLSLDGYYKGMNEDISWHSHGAEEAEFSAESSGSGNILLFGRKTYEMMASFWPTAMAAEQFPEVAKNMNSAKKIVVSASLTKADWNNSSIMKGNLAEEIKKLKQTATNDITILGSGSIVTQLAAENLMDAYMLMIDPVAIGNGTALFKGLTTPLNLQLTGSRAFKSGVLLLTYTTKG